MTDDKLTQLRKGYAKKKEQEKSTPLLMPVVSMKDARSREVIEFCIKKLSEGSTWNELRRMLGLGHAGVDRRWRTIRGILCSAIMPATDEQALKQDFETTTYLMDRLEQFVERMEKRSLDSEGKDNEHHMLKVQLDAIKLQFEAAASRINHYAEIKKLKDKDSGSQGASVIYQNNFFVPRPGQQVEWEDNKPVIRVEAPKPQNLIEQAIEIAAESESDS